jgi:endonuclease YncB( thermonuclease family)
MKTTIHPAAGASIFLACWLAGWMPAHAAVSSFAYVQSDGTLRMDNSVIRLYGIYIPPTDETCYDFVRPAMCGQRALLALRFKTEGEFVHCTERAVNPDHSITASCAVGNEDLGTWMLQRGWAAALPDAPYEYTVMERMARTRGIGIWGIPVELPPKFRR